MAEPISFARYRTQAAAPPLPQPAPLPPGMTGTLPLRPGAVRKFTTPQEAADLARLGIGKDDPVPEGLADLIKQELSIYGMTPVAPDTPPLKPIPETPLDRLPPERQAVIREAISQTIAMQRQAEAAPRIAGAGNGVNEALAVAATAPQQVYRTPVFSAPETVAAPPQPQSLSMEYRTPQPASAQVVIPPQPTTEPQPSPTGTDLPVTNCPRCGCHFTSYQQPTISQADAYAYLAMILGGPDARYRHDVSLFGGAVTVTFRTLTAADSRKAFEQLRKDNLREPITSDLAYTTKLIEYRLALSLDQVTFRGRGTTTIQPARDELELDLVVTWLRDDVLVSEVLVRAVLDAFHEFQRHVEGLEAKAEDSDFWQGIPSPRY